MAGPFPGMDPYIESQASWPDFHNSLISEIRNSLGLRLPDSYVARTDERVELVEFDGPTGRSYLPDVAIASEERAASLRRSSAATRTLALMEPEEFEVREFELEEQRHTWVEIKRLPQMELVTVIEVLSPVNKSGSGRSHYLSKRSELFSKRINLVEIDLLLTGARMPMKRPLPEGGYLAVVGRGTKLPKADVYRWSIRDRLPIMPVPLKAPDPDITIDLDELVGRVYDLGRYGRTLRYDTPLDQTLLLHPEDRSWAETMAKTPSAPST